MRRGEPRNTARWFAARGNKIWNEIFVSFFEHNYLNPVAERLASRTPPLPTFWIADIFFGRGEPRNTARWFVARGNKIWNENFVSFFEHNYLNPVAERQIRPSQTIQLIGR